MESLMTLRARASPVAASPLQQRRVPGRQRATPVRASAGGEPDLSVRVNGLQMPNPFVIGSGPPGTNYTVMKRAFDEGWGAVIAKTVSRSPSHPPWRWLRRGVVASRSLAPIFCSESVVVAVHLSTICGPLLRNSVLVCFDHERS
jgi:hypothetical protein